MEARTPGLTPSYDDKLNFAITLSVVAHVAIFVLLAVRMYFSPPQNLVLENVMKVDIVALPDKQVAQLPPIEAAPPQPEPAKPETKPEPPKPETKVDPAKLPPLAKPQVKPPDPTKVNLNKAKADQQAALKRLEALERLEKMSHKNTAPTAPTQPSSKPAAAAPPPIKGNQISTGASLKGIARLDHQNYLRVVHQQIKNRWDLPQWLASANLSARIRIFVDSHGNVTKKVLTQASKNPVYDDRVMKAIDDASPLTPPPGELANLLAVEGVELEFVPQ